ncbi:hypothetical protein VTP01DRAFT_5304 [Rhizomucor pusillus]|uniref:uncharacterized protein n=1 Tax=Rhizomucor pusillus TaxID=4840 RepID=UPI0037425DB2
MGIKKPSKSKLKREAKRAAKLKAEGKVPDKKHATEIADSNDEVPEAVPLQDLDLNAEEMQELEELEAAFKQLHDQEDNKSDDEEDEDENEQVENGVEEEEEEGESEAEENDEDDEDEEDSGDEDDEQDTDNKETRKPERVKANDKDKMLRILEEFKLKKLPWIETMSVTSSEPISVEDPNDDMKRELAFYQQALEAAKIGREKVLEAGVPFTRPDDYFAEMIKSDEHMAKIRTRLMNEAARVKASEDAKKQRHNKKFGKKLQLEKERERQKQKAETLEKIKQLKRKRKEGNNGDLTVNDDFDIALEKASGKPSKEKKSAQKSGKPEKSKKRQLKDAKYGMGGRKKYKKSNTAQSSAEDAAGYAQMRKSRTF